MKHLIFTVLLFYSCLVYGQDLILTVSGDSLKCKIIEVNTEEIQFRFGKGRIISINTSEVDSYQYNFESATGKDKPVKKTGGGNKTKPVSGESQNKEYLPLYISLSGGVRNFGSVSIGEMKGKAPIVVGFDAAYFFNSSFGAGLKFNMANSKVDFAESGCWDDRIMFIGAGLYGRWSVQKLELLASAAAGTLLWNMSNYKLNNATQPDNSANSFGAFLNAGISYKVSKNIGIGINFQSVIGKIKIEDGLERNPAGGGAVLILNFEL